MTFDLSESPKVKYFNFFWKSICDFISLLLIWTEVKYFIFFGNLVSEFILDLYWYKLYLVPCDGDS